jgi:hypothetical protein
MAILQDLTQKSNAELVAMIEAMRAQSTQRLTCKVTEKGGLSVYGLGRFPVTLYASQWDRLLTATPAIRDFMTAHASQLATKD